MKKFLLLAAILFLSNGGANASCAFHSSKNCQTAEGFIEEKKNQCASPETNCRRVFCERVCATNPCPGKRTDLWKLCVDNCTHIRFENASELHANLRACFGDTAAASSAITLSPQEDALARTIPGLVKKYRTQVTAEEQLAFKYQQAHEASAATADEIEATDDPYAEDLISSIRTEIQQKEGTFEADNIRSRNAGQARRKSTSRRASIRSNSLHASSFR